jgi:hypothetical protein
LEVLEEAFEDNELPAAALDYTGDHVFLLVSVPAPDSLVPEHKVDQTAAGNLTVKKRTKTESNAMYLAILASAMAATAKEAFAVAPSAQKGTVVGVRKDDASQEIAPLYLAEMDRGDLTRLGPGIDDIGQFLIESTRSSTWWAAHASFGRSLSTPRPVWATYLNASLPDLAFVSPKDQRESGRQTQDGAQQDRRRRWSIAVPDREEEHWRYLLVTFQSSEKTLSL